MVPEGESVHVDSIDNLMRLLPSFLLADNIDLEAGGFQGFGVTPEVTLLRVVVLSDNANSCHSLSSHGQSTTFRSLPLFLSGDFRKQTIGSAAHRGPMTLYIRFIESLNASALGLDSFR